MSRSQLQRAFRHSLLSEYTSDPYVRNAVGPGEWDKQYARLRALYALSGVKINYWDVASICGVLNNVSCIITFFKNPSAQNEEGYRLALFAIDLHFRLAVFFGMSFHELLEHEEVRQQYDIVNKCIKEVLLSKFMLQEGPMSELLGKRIQGTLTHIKGHEFTCGSVIVIQSIVQLAEAALGKLTSQRLSVQPLTPGIFKPRIVRQPALVLPQPPMVKFPDDALRSFMPDEIHEMRLIDLVGLMTFAMLRFNYARYKSEARLAEDRAAGRWGSVVGEPMPGLYRLVDQWDCYVESFVRYNGWGTMSSVSSRLPKEVIAELTDALGFYTIQLTRMHSRVAVAFDVLMAMPYEVLFNYVTDQKSETDTSADEAGSASAPMDCTM